MDNAKKKRLKKYISWAALAVVVLALAVMPMMAQPEEEADGPVASILDGTVQMGSVESTLQGGGTLSAGDAMNVTLPTGVKITEFLVKNGDMVAEGDPVAVVDKVSVMNAILEVQDTLEYLQDEIADAKDDTVSSTISATAGGLVKQVYGKAGDSVQDVMLEHGALAVLSLDSMMAVDLERDMALAAGDTVCVSFSDGTEVSGRVETNLNGVIVVTVNDDDYEVGTQVLVTTEDGDRIGAGPLYVHNAWKATAFSGTISTVYAKENTEVYSGSTLFTLTDTDFTGNLDSFASLHREYEELLQDLFRMYQDEVVTAPCDGMVSGVDEDSAFLLSAIEGEQGWFVDLLTNAVEEGSEKSWSVMLLSNEAQCDGTDKDGTLCTADEHIKGCYYYCTGLEGCTAKEHKNGCAYYCTMLPDCANANHKTGCLGVCTGDGDTCQSTRDHEYHLKSCIKRCISDQDEDSSTTCDADVHYDACIESCTQSEDCTALIHKEGCYFHGVTYTAYAAKVDFVSLEGLQVVFDTTTVYTVTPSADGWTLVSPSELKELFVGEATTITVADPSAYQAGDIILVVTGTNSSGETVYQGTTVHQNAQSDNSGYPGGMGGYGDLSSLFGGMGGMSGMSGLGGSASSAFELFDLDGDILMTVTEQDVMTLTIALDEQDISKVSVGQAAEVKVSALKGEVFEAEVTEIGTEGTNSGGSSKFTVELTMPLAENMLDGMSATASIPLYTKMNVLTIPVAALVEEGARTVVYTALDEENGEPTSPVEVTVGVSDGINAELLSGLDSGAVYYYSYYDTLELSTEVKSSGFSFGR